MIKRSNGNEAIDKLRMGTRFPVFDDVTGPDLIGFDISYFPESNKMFAFNVTFDLDSISIYNIDRIKLAVHADGIKYE